MSDRPPISLLECYRLQEALKGIQTLADMGIYGVECHAAMLQWTAKGTNLVYCGKIQGHTGEHEAN